tara:strand:- start:4252 stop:4959 length:708 start_codon:yes stop_codon:yes gene_type:complete
MTQFNLKKKLNRKKLFLRKDNILCQNGNKLINEKLKLIKKDFKSCLFLDETIKIKNKKINKFETNDLEKIENNNFKYDAVFSNFDTQIPFAGNIDQCLKSIHHKLNKDGLFCFNLLTPNSMSTIIKIFIEIDENVFEGTFNRFGPFHEISTIIEQLNKHNFNDIVVGTEFIEINYTSFKKLRDDFRDFGISNYYKDIPKFKKEFLTKTYNVFSKIIEKYNHIPVEFEIATFTSWK